MSERENESTERRVTRVVVFPDTDLYFLANLKDAFKISSNVYV